MSNVGGVDVPGQLARTPGGATVDLLRPETLNATTLGYDPAQILWAHGIRPSGDPRKDAEAALAVMSEREAYKERYPDETPAEIQQRIAGPRYNPRAAQAAGEAAMRKAAGLENKPRRANALGEMEEWYDPADYGFAEGTGETPIIIDPYLANPALANAEMRERTQDWNRGFPERHAKEQAERAAGPPYPGMIWGNVGQGPMGTVFGWRWPPGSIFGPQPKLAPQVHDVDIHVPLQSLEIVPKGLFQELEAAESTAGLLH